MGHQTRDGGTELRADVRRKYGEAALWAAAGLEGGCCGTGLDSDALDPITGGLYDPSTAADIPEAALGASLGCGNPTALAELGEGETVLDLGSGGGIDVLLSARRVGPTGRVYGLDMTDEMLELARRTAAAAGTSNVEFLKGEIEAIPLPDESVDVVISNCVVNLSADKPRVLAEAFRVLRPGGRFAISDVVVRGAVPHRIRESMELWIGCIAGALEASRFEALLHEAGFEDPSVEPTRIYEVEDARSFLSSAGIEAHEIDGVAGRFAAAFVRARKPDAPTALVSPVASDVGPCCGPECCG